MKLAGLTVGGKVLAENIRYSLGSSWSPVPTSAQTFVAVSDTSSKESAFSGATVNDDDDDEATATLHSLATAPFSPPSAP